MISIIVPIYNAEMYLSECIESILSQTYKDFELILVNDGSTDKSLDLCQKYQNLDKRIVIIDQENMGVAKARNNGIKLAKGEFVFFVDSDDFINANILTVLFDAINQKDVDISMCEFKTVYRRENEVQMLEHNSTTPVLCTPDEALKTILLNRNIDVFLWNKLYKKDLFRNIQIAEDVVCEDLATTYRIITQAKMVTIVNEPLYYYCVRKNSISKTFVSSHELDVIKVCEDMTIFINEFYPDLNTEMAQKYLQVCVNFLNQQIGSKPDTTSDTTRNEYIELISLKIRDLKELLDFEKLYTKKQQFMLKMILNSPRTYVMFYKLFRRIYKIEEY